MTSCDLLYKMTPKVSMEVSIEVGAPERKQKELTGQISYGWNMEENRNVPLEMGKHGVEVHPYVSWGASEEGCSSFF